MDRLNKNFRGLMMVCALFSILILAGCNDNSVTNPNEIQQVRSASDKGGPLNTLRLDSVKVLVSSVTTGLRGSSRGVTGNRSNSEVLIYPAAVKVNLNSGVNDVTIAMSQYNRLDMYTFHIGKYNPAIKPPDINFNYNGTQYYILAYGVFNEQPFVFRSQRECQETIFLETPITVSAMDKKAFTLFVKTDNWFRGTNGYVDPSDPANQEEIDNRISASFKEYSPNIDR